MRRRPPPKTFTDLASYKAMIKPLDPLPTPGDDQVTVDGLNKPQGVIDQVGNGSEAARGYGVEC
ncbi:hypothetical protein MCERE10_01808 [Burkholderiaceae bacterium]